MERRPELARLLQLPGIDTLARMRDDRGEVGRGVRAGDHRETRRWSKGYCQLTDFQAAPNSVLPGANGGDTPVRSRQKKTGVSPLLTGEVYIA